MAEVLSTKALIQKSKGQLEDSLNISKEVLKIRKNKIKNINNHLIANSIENVAIC